MASPIVVELDVSAAPDAVWRAFTENAKLERWLCAQANVDARVGGAYELFWEPEHPERNSTQGCTVTALEEGRRIAFTWRGPVPYAHLMNAGDPPPTHVVVTLAARSGARASGSAIRLEHAGWGDGAEWDAARTWQERAWRGAFDELAKLLG